MELTFHFRLPHPCTSTRVPLPIPLPSPSPIPGACELPIKVEESDKRTGMLDRRSKLSRKPSAQVTEPMARPCTGVYLEMPDGVLPYSAYPFMLHEVFVLP
jgi:hypothetical protein